MSSRYGLYEFLGYTRVTKVVTIRCEETFVLCKSANVFFNVNRSKSRKPTVSSNCSLETREHEVGIASNRKLVHYG